MRLYFLMVVVLGIGCVGSDDNNLVSDTGVDADLGTMLYGEVSYNYCGASDEVATYCSSGFVCVEGVCCAEDKTQVCNGECFPADCQCAIEDGLKLCISDGQFYCGAGVICDDGEQCLQDDEYFYCFPQDNIYCGNGLVCLDSEKCVKDDGQSHCIPKDANYCGSGSWCQSSEICVEGGCCPKEKSQTCNDDCCFAKDVCISEESLCISDTSDYCGDGFYCLSGSKCVVDGLKMCVPAYADDCGEGRYCPAGDVCIPDSCCPQGMSQVCGSICCPDGWQCLKNGQMCIPPNATLCANFYCQPGEICAFDKQCVPINSELCEDGHWCPPALHCTGSTCCQYNAPAQCGDLCCPSSWDCIGNGQACIPPGSQSCGNFNTWCLPGEICMENGKCMPVGWEECGAGQACDPNSVCLNNKKCCPKSQAVLCGGQCCPTGYQCIDNDFCIPPGAESCEGNSEQKWCPAATYCGKKFCIENGADECDDGSICPVNTVCTNLTDGPQCCSVAASKICGNECCPMEYECQFVNGDYYCTPWGVEICSSGVTCQAGYICTPDNQYCMPPGSDYCGNGVGCGPGMQCAEFSGLPCCPQGHSVACLIGCCPDHTICRVYPNTSGPTGYLNPKEECLNWPVYYSQNLNQAAVFQIEKDKSTWEDMSKGTAGDSTKNPPKPPDEYLVVEAALVIDNLETDECKLLNPHGPFGRLTYDVHPGDLLSKVKDWCGWCGNNQVCLYLLSNNANYGYKTRALRGPHRGPPCACWCIGLLTPWGCAGKKTCAPAPEDEWWDNEFMRYAMGQAAIYKWQTNSDEETITLSIMESDSNELWGLKFGASDDIGGIEIIKKNNTKGLNGLWVPFYKYETVTWEAFGSAFDTCVSKLDHISVYLLVRTVTCTDKPGDPC